jgi:formate hydrogenlyase subunit 4
MAVGDVILAVLQVVLVATGAPLLLGTTRTLKARLVGRRGASPLQPYRDLTKLLAKEVVVSTTTSWIFRVTPYVLVAAMLLAALLVPVIVARPAAAFAGGIVLLMYVLLLGTFFLALAGLDAGSAFGGMGSSREVAVAALAEPTVILAVLALAIRAGTTNLAGIVEHFAAHPAYALNPGHLLAFTAFFIVMIAETGRLPVDNPATHLELTMIHEAMVLEYSGRYLALVEWASAMKLTLFMALLANVFFPFGVTTAATPGAVAVGLVVLVVKLLALSVVLALTETTVAKLRLFRVPELLAGSFALALLSVISVFVLR